MSNVATMTAKIKIDTSGSIKDLLSQFGEMQKTADKNFITYKITGDKSQLDTMLNQVKSLDPSVNVQFLADRSEFDKTMNDMKKIAGKSAKEIQDSFRTSSAGTSFITGIVGSEKDTEKIRKSLVTQLNNIRRETKDIKLDSLTDYNSVANYTEKLQQMSAILNELNKKKYNIDNGVLNLGGRNTLKISDELTELERLSSSASEKIATNLSSWMSGLQSQFDSEFKMLQDWISTMGQSTGQSFGQSFGQAFSNEINKSIQETENLINSLTSEIDGLEKKLSELQNKKDSQPVVKEDKLKQIPIRNKIDGITQRIGSQYDKSITNTKNLKVGDIEEINKAKDYIEQVKVEIKSLLQEYLNFGGDWAKLKDVDLLSKLGFSPEQFAAINNTINSEIQSTIDIINTKKTELATAIANLEELRSKSSQGGTGNGSGTGNGNGTGNGQGGNGQPASVPTKPEVNASEFINEVNNQLKESGLKAEVDVTGKVLFPEIFKTDVETSLGETKVNVDTTGIVNDPNSFALSVTEKLKEVKAEIDVIAKNITIDGENSTLNFGLSEKALEDLKTVLKDVQDAVSKLGSSGEVTDEGLKKQIEDLKSELDSLKSKMKETSDGSEKEAIDLSGLLDQISGKLKDIFSQDGLTIKINDDQLNNLKNVLGEIKTAIESINSIKIDPKISQPNLNINDVLKGWAEQTSIQGRQSNERYTVANSQNDYVGNNSLLSKAHSVTSEEANRIIEYTKNVIHQVIDTFVHSHPEKEAAFSFDDISKSFDELKNGITKQVVTAVNSTMMIDYDLVDVNKQTEILDAVKSGWDKIRNEFLTKVKNGIKNSEDSYINSIISAFESSTNIKDNPNYNRSNVQAKFIDVLKGKDFGSYGEIENVLKNTFNEIAKQYKIDSKNSVNNFASQVKDNISASLNDYMQSEAQKMLLEVFGNKDFLKGNAKSAISVLPTSEFSFKSAKSQMMPSESKIPEPSPTQEDESKKIKSITERLDEEKQKLKEVNDAIVRLQSEWDELDAKQEERKRKYESITDGQIGAYNDALSKIQQNEASKKDNNSSFVTFDYLDAAKKKMEEYAVSAEGSAEAEQKLIKAAVYYNEYIKSAGKNAEQIGDVETTQLLIEKYNELYNLTQKNSSLSTESARKSIQEGVTALAAKKAEIDAEKKKKTAINATIRDLREEQKAEKAMQEQAMQQPARPKATATNETLNNLNELKTKLEQAYTEDNTLSTKAGAEAALNFLNAYKDAIQTGKIKLADALKFNDIINNISGSSLSSSSKGTDLFVHARESIELFEEKLNKINNSSKPLGEAKVNLEPTINEGEFTTNANTLLENIKLEKKVELVPNNETTVSNGTEQAITSQDELQREIAETEKYIEDEKKKLESLNNLINGNVSFKGKKEATDALKHWNNILNEQENSTGRQDAKTIVTYNNVRKAAEELGVAQSNLNKYLNAPAVATYEKALEQVKGSYEVTQQSIDLFTKKVEESKAKLNSPQQPAKDSNQYSIPVTLTPNINNEEFVTNANALLDNIKLNKKVNLSVLNENGISNGNESILEETKAIDENKKVTDENCGSLVEFIKLIREQTKAMFEGNQAFRERAALFNNENISGNVNVGGYDTVNWSNSDDTNANIKAHSHTSKYASFSSTDLNTFNSKMNNLIIGMEQIAMMDTSGMDGMQIYNLTEKFKENMDKMFGSFKFAESGIPDFNIDDLYDHFYEMIQNGITNISQKTNVDVADYNIDNFVETQTRLLIDKIKNGATLKDALSSINIKELGVGGLEKDVQEFYRQFSETILQGFTSQLFDFNITGQDLIQSKQFNDIRNEALKQSLLDIGESSERFKTIDMSNIEVTYSDIAKLLDLIIKKQEVVVANSQSNNTLSSSVSQPMNDSIQGGTTGGSSMQYETQDAENLRAKLVEVTTAVDNKTRAFKEEEQVVTGTVQAEITLLETLDGQLVIVKESVEKLITEIERLGKLPIEFNINPDSIDESLKDALSSLSKSVEGIDPEKLKALSDNLNSKMFGANKNGDNPVALNIQKIANAITNLKAVLNNAGMSGTPLLSDIKDIIGQKDEIKALATILSSTKKEIETAKKAVNAKDNKPKEKTQTQKSNEQYGVILNYEKEIAKLTKEQISTDATKRRNAQERIDEYRILIEQAEQVIKNEKLENQAKEASLKIIRDQIALQEQLNERILDQRAEREAMAEATSTIDLNALMGGTWDIDVLKELEGLDDEWLKAITAAHSYADVLGDVVDITRKIVRNQKGEYDESYVITGKDGNTVTKGLNGDYLMSSQKVVDDLSKTKELEQLYKSLNTQLDQNLKLQKAIANGDKSKVTSNALLQNESNILDIEERINQLKQDGIKNDEQAIAISQKRKAIEKDMADIAQSQSNNQKKNQLNQWTNEIVGFYKKIASLTASLPNEGAEEAEITRKVIKALKERIRYREEAARIRYGDNAFNRNQRQSIIDAKTGLDRVEAKITDDETKRIAKQQEDEYNATENRYKRERALSEAEGRRQEQEWRNQTDSYVQFWENALNRREIAEREANNRNAQRENSIQQNRDVEAASNIRSFDLKIQQDYYDTLIFYSQKYVEALKAEAAALNETDKAIAKSIKRHYAKETKNLRNDMSANNISTNPTQEVKNTGIINKGVSDAAKISSDTTKKIEDQQKRIAVAIDNTAYKLKNLQSVGSGKIFKDTFSEGVKEIDAINDRLKNGSITTLQEYKQEIQNVFDKIKNAKDVIKDFGTTPISYQSAIGEMDKYISSLAGSHKVTRDTVQNLEGEITAINYAWNEDNGVVRKVTLTYDEVNNVIRATPLKQQTKDIEKNTSAWEKFTIGLKGKWQDLFRYLATFASFYRIWAWVKQGVNYVKELDTALTEMRKVSDETMESLKNFQDVSFEMAGNIGSTAVQIQQSAADFMRLGYSLKDASELAKDANIYANVGDMEIDEATEHMISSIKAWGSEFSSEVEASRAIIDKYNEIGNNFAITSADIGEAMERSAAALKAGGNTLDESLGLITAGNLINQDAESTANALKVMSLRIRGSKTELEEMGESTDDLASSTSKLRGEIKALTGVDIMADEKTYKSTAQIIQDIGAIWDKLDDISKANVLEKLAGKTRASVAAGLLENYKTIQDVMDNAATAEGSAEKENQRYMESIEGRLERLSNAAQKFWYDFLNSDVIKKALEAVTGLLNLLDKTVGKTGAVTTGILAIGASLAKVFIKSNKSENGGGRVKYYI